MRWKFCEIFTVLSIDTFDSFYNIWILMQKLEFDDYFEWWGVLYRMEHLPQLETDKQTQ